MSIVIKTGAELKGFIEDYERLRQIAQKLSYYNELIRWNSLSEKLGKRRQRLLEEARRIAERWGLEISFPTDPRFESIRVALGDNPQISLYRISFR